MSATTNSSRLTLTDLRAMRVQREPIAVLTAYDFVTAALLDEAGIDILLVGDSLANVVLGHETTIPVTLDAMIHHAQAVVRGSSRSFVICDLPFGETTDPETALRASVRVMKEAGCQGVKLEGGKLAAPIVSRIIEQGIPVMGHIGLTPQSVHQLGGFYKHGKTDDAAARLLEDALALEAAGAFAIVLEMITPQVAADITDALQIPTIGIGSGDKCAGQVLVINDLIGLGVRPAPKFAKPRADVASIIRAAAEGYVHDLKRPGSESECLPGSPSMPAIPAR
jgi:3-methyl-2-oxobutanoate hydroxymethyltransferase